jgi:hypothetical protein
MGVMAHLVHNERAKLIANALDRASTGCFATGLIVPVGATMLGQPLAVSLDTFVVSFACWIFVGIILHIEAQRVINTMRE